MCLAVPAQVVACEGEQITVDMQGNQLTVSKVLTPEADVGSWVLVHAGFAITQLDEQEARETWDYLQEALGMTPPDCELEQRGVSTDLDEAAP
jgi:hydrogenase expression/formation protein HypC